MELKFLVFPKQMTESGVADDTQFSVVEVIDPIVRFSLTMSLNRLGLTNLRPFMRADRYGEPPLAEF